ncbi:hypothetical protein [Peribacillus frigoritolerans]|uniref:hypothetical protein n=1 Tax=Peribacillus frigoritolerans TaxID=450367 RepID=UPI002EB37C69|nr:hypothetical protein [Peribacillus frigoritolerans]
MNFPLLLVGLEQILVNFPLLLVNLELILVNFPLLLVNLEQILVNFPLLLVGLEQILVNFPLLLVSFEQTKKHGVRKEFLHHALFILLFTMHFEFKEEFVVTGQVFLPKVFVHFQFLRQFR